MAQACSRFQNVTQQECLDKTWTTTSESEVNCIIQFSPLGQQFQSIIHKHWSIIESDSALKCLSVPPHIVSKGPSNLRHMLVRAELPSLTQPHFLQRIPYGSYRCVICSLCNFTHKTNSFRQSCSGKLFNIKGVISCNTSNVIYMLKCPCCVAYIGQTTRSIKTRISEHRSNNIKLCSCTLYSSFSHCFVHQVSGDWTS